MAPATYASSVVVDFGQAIPRPVCNDGPHDWLYVTGPVTFTTFVADVAGEQNGKTGPHTRKVRSWGKRLAKQHGAPEMLTEILQLGSVGTLRDRVYERCFA